MSWHVHDNSSAVCAARVRVCVCVLGEHVLLIIFKMCVFVRDD